jgi:hypothetical protein
MGWRTEQAHLYVSRYRPASLSSRTTPGLYRLNERSDWPYDTFEINKKWNLYRRLQHCNTGAIYEWGLSNIIGAYPILLGPILYYWGLSYIIGTYPILLGPILYYWDLSYIIGTYPILLGPILYYWFQTIAMFWMSYAFFCVIPRHLWFKCQHFGTLFLFHLHRRVGMKYDWGWECGVLYVSRLGSKNSLSPLSSGREGIYREIIAVCSQIHTKHIKTQSVPRSKHTPSQL